MPHQNKRSNVDAAASEMLANARTAAEYVNRAMEMRNKHRTPHSSYVKYDVFEKEETQSLPDYNAGDYDSEIIDDINSNINQIEMPLHGGNYYASSDSVTQRSSKHYSNNDYQRKPNYNRYKEPEQSYGSDYQTQYDTDHAYDDPPYKVVDPPYGSSNADIPKSEIIKHIQHSVMKYMKELEVEGKLPAASVSSERPYTELKTYYRVMPSTTVSPYHDIDAASNQASKIKEKQKVHNTVSSTHSEYFKPAVPPAKSYQSYTTPSDSYHSSTIPTPSYHNGATYSPESVTPHIDLTFRSKARPKPIDLTALDVGQTWSHNLEHPTPTPPTNKHHSYRSTPKPKLHLNSQAYHEINSMTYSPDKDHSNEESDTYESAAHHTPVRFKNGMANVGSSISVGQDGRDEAVVSDQALRDLQDNYRGSMHVINGIPISNPYKFNVQQLK